MFCDFYDKGFQDSIQAMKKLNLVNGRFDLDLTMKVLSYKGHVKEVTLVGTRADMSNLFMFAGTVFDIIRIFDPSAVANDAAVSQVTKELGLMRGDSADDIGKPRVGIYDGVAVTCGAGHSDETMAVGCRFEPRS